MSLVKRGNIYWTDFTINGHRYQESTGFSTKTKAREYEDKRKLQIREQVKLGRVTEMTLAEAASHYADSVLLPKAKRAGVKGERNYKYELGRIKIIETHFGPEKPISETVSRAAIAGFNRFLLRTRQANSANRILNTFRAIANHAFEAGGLSAAPLIKANKTNDAREMYLTLEQEQTLLESCPPYLADIVTFILDTGARKEEALSLTWGQVTLAKDSKNRSTVTFFETKNKTPRTVPLPKRSAELLNRLHKNRPDKISRVFLWTPPGETKDEAGNSVKKPPVPVDNVKKSWDTARKAANMPTLRMHDLRHTYASKLVSKGQSLYDVGKLLGHRSIKMTERYAHLYPGHLNQAVAALD